MLRHLRLSRKDANTFIKSISLAATDRNLFHGVWHPLAPPAVGQGSPLELRPLQADSPRAQRGSSWEARLPQGARRGLGAGRVWTWVPGSSQSAASPGGGASDAAALPPPPCGRTLGTASLASSTRGGEEGGAPGPPAVGGRWVAGGRACAAARGRAGEGAPSVRAREAGRRPRVEGAGPRVSAAGGWAGGRQVPPRPPPQPPPGSGLVVLPRG